MSIGESTKLLFIPFVFAPIGAQTCRWRERGERKLKFIHMFVALICVWIIFRRVIIVFGFVIANLLFLSVVKKKTRERELANRG